MAYSVDSEICFPHEPQITVLCLARVHLDNSVYDLVLVQLTLETEFLTTLRMGSSSFDVRKDGVETLMVH